MKKLPRNVNELKKKNERIDSYGDYGCKMLCGWEQRIFKYRPTPVKVIFNPPATIVYFNDGDKVISKCDKHDELQDFSCAV